LVQVQTVSVVAHLKKTDFCEAPLEVSLNGHFLVPNLPNHYYVPRDTAFNRLRRLFSPKTRSACHRLVALFGLGGVGKSRIAIEYAHRHRAEYSSVFWVSGSSRQKLINDYIGIASKVYQGSVSDKDSEGIAKVLKLSLESEVAATHKWLLIVDGADEIDQIEDLLPRAGHVLVTTRDAEAVEDEVEINEMSNEEATDLFCYCLEEDWDPEKIDIAWDIVKVLGYLPLAIEQSAAYIRETRCSLARYLEIWKTSRKELGNRHRMTGRGGEYRRTLEATWTVSFDKLKTDSPVAAELLSLIAFLDSESIPEDLLRRGLANFQHRHLNLRDLGRDEELYEDAIRAINKFSLISRRPNTDRIRVHVLVGNVMRDWLERQGSGHQWVATAIELLSNIFPERTDCHHSAAVTRRMLISHVSICLDYLKCNDLDLVDELGLFNSAGSFLYETGDYEGARDCFDTLIKKIATVAGRRHRYVAEALVNLSVVYQRIGLWNDALRAGEEALGIAMELYGPEHGACVRPLHILARTLQWKGERQRARETLAHAMRIAERNSTPHNPHSHLHHLLVSLGKERCYEGKWDEGHSLLSQAMKSGEEMEDFQFTAKSLKTMGRYRYFRKEWKKAREHVKEALRLRLQYFGLESPDTASVLGCLGSILIHENDYHQAEKYFRQAIDLQKDTKWKEDYGMVHHLCGLGCAVAKQGRLKEGREFYLKALGLQKKWQGRDPLIAAWVLNSLGAIFAAEGSFEESEEFLKEALSIRKRISGLGNSETKEALCQLVTLYQLTGNYLKASEQLRDLTSEPIKVEFWGYIRHRLGIFPPEMYLTDGMDAYIKQKVLIQYGTWRWSVRRIVLFPMWMLSMELRSSVWYIIFCILVGAGIMLFRLEK
jgi:tetratricopeptide (TPR) repeat protein